MGWGEGLGDVVGVGDGVGGSWVLLLSVEDPFKLSSFLFASKITTKHKRDRISQKR